jgi:hypothetical protein
MANSMVLSSTEEYADKTTNQLFPIVQMTDLGRAAPALPGSFRSVSFRIMERAWR